MGDDSLILREDGYIRMNFPITSLTYHNYLNIILVKSDDGVVHVLDVNSGVILQSSCLSGDEKSTLGVEYAPGAERVFVWDSSGVGARTEYNGVLLLHTALQRPLPSSQIEKSIRIELVLSEAVLLYQCLQGLDINSVEGLLDFVKELKNSIDAEPVRKGVKAQKWSTVTICLPQSTLRLVTTSVVQELKGQNRRIPALAIASAVGQRANDLVPCSREEETRPLMYSEAERKETFKRWPHMDYKWALPVRMAQAGFYHQPSPSGDDRAMCFTCLVCLVCWEKSDEPWVEHERHSPNCPFVRGEYTHNVPISVTNATASAVPCPNVKVVSKGNLGDLIATGTTDGKVNVWRFDCGLKLVKFMHLTPYDSIFSGILSTDIKMNTVWGNSIEKDMFTYSIELTAMSFIGMTTQSEPYPQVQNADRIEKENRHDNPKPSLVCAVIVTRTPEEQSNQPIKDDASKALFDSGGPKESIQEMNDQNEAKSNQSNKMLFLLTYDIYSPPSRLSSTLVPNLNSSGNPKPGGSKKVCTVARTDDANIYDDIYFQYSDEDTDLPPNVVIDEQISNVINLNASSSKEDNKIWHPTKKIILTKHIKVVPPPGAQPLLSDFHHHAADPAQASVLDFVGKISQLKSWKSGTLDNVGTKLADQTDAAVLNSDPHLHHYLMNMSGPLEISDLKWYEGGEGTEKVKVTTALSGIKLGTHTISKGNNDCFESEPPQEEAITQGITVQCLLLPAKLNLPDDAKVTHLFPTEDKEHLLVIVSSIDPEKVKTEEEPQSDGVMKMEVDDNDHNERLKLDTKAYFLLYKMYTKTPTYTLEDNPVMIKELSFEESPVDLCLLPGENEQYSFASVGVDGALRLYSLPDFRILSEHRVPRGQFTSITYCASVDRLSASTKHGIIYFYALNNGEKDSSGDMDEDEFANIDFDMLQRAPREETGGAPVIIANKPELDMADLETLITLTGSYGTNTTIPYSAVVPGFWCELSPAQRPRSDHQNNRTWRLQNTSSTWDEHVLELTLPYSVSLAHIEFAFSLHSACSSNNLPVIMVTLLKQNLHGIGYKKDATFSHRSESPITFPVIDADISNMENPIHSEEYLQAHNAEILAGPLLLSSGLDATKQSGVLTLTSPRLYRARGRTFLIHIKTLFDPAKDMSKGSSKSEDKSKKFIGCDWLHQISLTVRSSPHTDVPMERQQRIAMLESNSFLNTLCEIAVSKEDVEKRKLALDIIIWVVSVRLQRMRLAKTDKGKLENEIVESQQMECIKILETHIDAMIRTCILCADRSVAKKCVRIILITRAGEKQVPMPWKCTFSASVCSSAAACVPFVGGVRSAGALRWLAALVQRATPAAAAAALVSRLLLLLQRAAAALQRRQTPDHHLLRARFGLYGLPFERAIFAPETAELGRNVAPMSYASMLVAEATTPPQILDHQLKELLNWPKEQPPPSEQKSLAAWWAGGAGAGVFALGLGEATPLHVSCHLASDGTKLESSGARVHAAVVALPAAGADPHQLWSAVKEGQLKQSSQDPDSLEDVDSSLMDCDPHEKLEFSEDKLFKEQEQCGIPWAALVTRPPQHTLLVERMHSGARRYIVLDFGHVVRLSDVIIPSCSDLVTLCIDIWVTSEETDCVKLAFATDIANRNLVLTDLQPPPLCRYMKITTIGRYGMSAMKCKIPLGWFYGEIAEIANPQASINALNALQQDLSCRFRLATGKLSELLSQYQGLYNGNACHMMAYLSSATEGDTRVTAAYHECIELQQQLHTCTHILAKLQHSDALDEGAQVADAIGAGEVSPELLLETASTDKLRVIAENVVDMLLYFYFQVPDVQYPSVERSWCEAVLPLVWQSGGAAAGALGTLVARVCGPEPWWGDALAAALADAFAPALAPPTPLDRCLVLVMYMCRKSMFSHLEGGGGVAVALCSRALELVRRARPQPALTAAVLTALAAVLDAAPAHAAHARHARWDWVSGGRVGHSAGGGGGGVGAGASVLRAAECRMHRRKLHKKLLHQMQELEAAKRGIHEQLEDQQRTRLNLKARYAMVGKRRGGEAAAEGCPRVVPASLASALAAALVQHMLAADSASDADDVMLCAKVVGRLCALSGGGHLLEPSSILGLARLAVTLPPWPRHALTTLLQDLVEFENVQGSEDTWSSSRVILVTPERAPRPAAKARKHKGPSVADLLADSLGLQLVATSTPKSSPPASMSNAILNDLDAEEQLNTTHVAESDDSDSSEEPDYHVPDKKDAKAKLVQDNTHNNISRCADARLEGAGGGAGGAGEAAAREALLRTGAALAAAVRADPPRPPPAPAPAAAPAPPRTHPPLSHTLYDVFRYLALEFHNQMECTFMENVVSLWLTLNGSSWSPGCTWSMAASLGALSLPNDAPRIRLSSDTVTALLHALCTYENVSLRCWVLSMQALAWIATLPLQTEGSTQTMGRVILECEHFVPALVKFVTMDVAAEGMVAVSEPYLAGNNVGAGAGAATALQAVVSRVACSRGPAGAAVTLRAVAAAWRRDATPPAAYDLHATLLRLAQAMLQGLGPKHAHHALPLIASIAHHSSVWVREVSWTGAESGEGRAGAGGTLVEMVVGGGTGGRRAPSRRSVLAQLLTYARRLLHTPLPQHNAQAAGASTEQSQTDESKAQAGANMEDERKQQAARTRCLADSVIERPEIMQKFYKTLSLCESLNMLIVSSDGVGTETSATVKEEVFWLVAQIAATAASPALMVPGLMEYLRRDDTTHLSVAMQQLIVRLLEQPEALTAFIDAGGLELAVQKLTAKHQSGPSHRQGLVSSLMNYLKLPPQLINMSTPANKKAQPPVVDTASGLINIAPLCTISCGNPTAQSADVLLEGGGAGGGARGACAARRVRAAAWSYHFFSADDASLALTLTLPYAARLHEVQLQPHLTSLATCPGAVSVEAGCGGTLAPLGPPQNTSGMTYIRLVVARPVVCTVVQLRLYKPRDSSNMGLLQLRLLAAPAFALPQHPTHNTNNWAVVVSWCARAEARLSSAQWAALGSGAAVRALCACVAGGGSAALAAARALLAAARAHPPARAPLLHALLDMDTHAHAHAFRACGGGGGRGRSGLVSVCALVRQLCRWCPPLTVHAFVGWLRAAARAPDPPAPALLHTLASVLWTLKEKELMAELEDLVPDDLFDIVFTWLRSVPDDSLLKKALDDIMCSMCYIRPELFRCLLERLNIPIDMDESMECQTDDTKVTGAWGGAGGGAGGGAAAVARLVSAGGAASVAAAARSPAAAAALLASRLPHAVVDALTEFAEERLAILKEQAQASPEEAKRIGEESMIKKAPEDRADVACMSRARHLVEWVRSVCWSRRGAEWAGGPGAAFWTPLLRLLCHPQRGDTTWRASAQFAELEESTIMLFAEVTACNPHNQKLFATTLHAILESLPQTEEGEGISGFSRALILRLVLSGGRVRVALAWSEPEAEAAPGAAPPHPALAAHALRTLPAATTVRALLADHRPPLPVMEETCKPSPAVAVAAAPVLRSASDPAITTVAEAWELTLAAASASKDKRVKDVKNTTLKNQNNKKRNNKNDTALTVTDDVLESTIRVQAEGVEGFIPGGATLAQLCAAAPHVAGPHLTLLLHLNTAGEWSGGTTANLPVCGGEASDAVLREFGACGGLALVAARLPRPHAPPPDPPARHHHHHDFDWVKLEDAFEEVVELGVTASGGGGGGGAGAGGGGAGGGGAEEAACGIPAHALGALGLLLKLPGYAAALLDEGAPAVQLLRLLMGVAHTDDGRSISVGGCGGKGGYSLGTLPFRVVSRLLEAAPRGSDEGRSLRAALLASGAARMLLACLAVFTHHRPHSAENSQASNGSAGRGEEKSQLYWAKGTGFGTGSTQQSWNVEQALVRQRTEEEHVTVLLQVIASYMNPGEQWPPEEGSQPEAAAEEEPPEPGDDLPPDFLDLVAGSSLLPAICSYLRNDSVLDMSRHIPLYVCVLRCARALHAAHARRLAQQLRPLPRLLAQMSRTTNSYATKLKMSKKNIFGKMTYSQRFTASSNSELSEEDEGLATLIADIQATSALMCRAETELESSAPSSLSVASRDQRYIELMRGMQFETFEMITECGEHGFRFTVPYHFESTVRAAGERSAPARMKRLAQEAATLATSLPLSYSSSVFVRTDTDRLDVMKVLITGPSDTPYANGCFVLDVYFPAEYPAVPMHINLETTGRHSVRFNPNLYNDGKVCLSVLNTWHGRPEEKWNAHTSSFLQVLVSIQSLILVPEPYFNEPGYERSRGTRVGAAASTEYNSNIYQACVRWAMLDHLRNPEPCFKEVIQTHFWIKRNEIIKTVADWITELEGQHGDERTQRSIHHNLMALKRHYVKLQEELGKLSCPAGLEELDEPLSLPAPVPAPPSPSSTAATAGGTATPPAADLDHDHDMEQMVSHVLD